jgi:hypothetical protein
VDVREGRQQLPVEAGRTFVAAPDVAALWELVDAVGGERGEQAFDIPLVLGDRVALPELADRVVLARG